MSNQMQSLSRIRGLTDRRKVKNLLLKPTLQLQLPLYVLLISFVFLLLILLLANLYFEQAFVSLVETTSKPEHQLTTIIGQTSEFRNMALLLLAGYAVLIVVVTSIYTHRLIGPLIPIMRHVKALQKGVYSQRVKLRRRDAYQELAWELNELTEILEKRYREQ